MTKYILSTDELLNQITNYYYYYQEEKNNSNWYLIGSWMRD